MSAVYTLFFGTFIQLPRAPLNGKHVLAIQKGALWVSTADGRIEGFDWNVQNEEGLGALMKRMGWVVEGADVSQATETVRVVRAEEERNEFFFPGFIGWIPFFLPFLSLLSVYQSNHEIKTPTSTPPNTPTRAYLALPPYLTGSRRIHFLSKPHSPTKTKHKQSTTK